MTIQKENRLNIPNNWTFEGKEIADKFDAHVREQLPWYDLATKAVEHLGRHYITQGGLVYDIGASTGNITSALLPIVTSREASIFSIEQSMEMVKIMDEKLDTVANSEEIRVLCVVHADALEYDYKPFDFAVCFLTLMFLPLGRRSQFVKNLITLIKPGGALVVVDKCVTPPGYIGTVLRRLALSWKLESGTPPEDILRKELSLAGYQRPISPEIFNCDYQEFFRFGEFAGWVIERSEEE